MDILHKEAISLDVLLESLEKTSWRKKYSPKKKDLVNTINKFIQFRNLAAPRRKNSK